MAKLTSKEIQSASCPSDKNRKVFYDEDGLMLRVMGATQAKSWLLKYRYQGKETQISLGSFLRQFSLRQSEQQSFGAVCDQFDFASLGQVRGRF